MPTPRFAPHVPAHDPETVAVTIAPASPIALEANDALVLSVTT